LRGTAVDHENIKPDVLVDHSLIRIGFLASLAAGAATGVGALPVFLPVIRISPRAQDVMLGFAAGVMLASSTFSLIVPGLEAAAAMYGGELEAAFTVGCGIMPGAVGLWLINEHVPHEHFILGREGVVSASLRRIWLFVIAITLHNFPEGLAVGGRLRHGRPRQGKRARDRHRPAEPTRGSRRGARSDQRGLLAQRCLHGRAADRHGGAGRRAGRSDRGDPRPAAAALGVWQSPQAP
jgi:hypothetical protein